jgi:hypothetical protein
MNDGVSNWIVWLASEMDQLHRHSGALDRLREYAREVAGTEGKHATALRDDAGTERRTPAEQAMILVRLHDHFCDADASSALKDIAGRKGWTPLLCGLGIPLDEEISVVAYLHAVPKEIDGWTADGERGVEREPDEYLRSLFAGLGMKLEREAPREEPAALTGPTAPEASKPQESGRLSARRKKHAWVGEAIKLLVEDTPNTSKTDSPKYIEDVALARAVGVSHTTVGRYMKKHEHDASKMLVATYGTYKKLWVDRGYRLPG